MKIHDVVILTDNRYTNPQHIDDYIQNVLDEDGIVKTALENLGLCVLRLSWDDPNFDWSTTKSVLFRSTWDYFDRFTEFSQWLNRVSQQTQLLNSEAIIRWNLDKHYLIDLAKKGVNICNTIFIEQGETKSLQELAIANDLTDFVIKPCVSGAARETYHIQIEHVDAHEANFQKLIRQEAMMLQPFQHSVPVKGEVSYMVMNGKFTHAVLKKPNLVIFVFRMILVARFTTISHLQQKSNLQNSQRLVAQNHRFTHEWIHLPIIMVI